MSNEETKSAVRICRLADLEASARTTKALALEVAPGLDRVLVEVGIILRPTLSRVLAFAFVLVFICRTSLEHTFWASIIHRHKTPIGKAHQSPETANSRNPAQMSLDITRPCNNLGWNISATFLMSDHVCPVI